VDDISFVPVGSQLLSATAYSRAANQVLVSARLPLVAILSVLVLRAWWKKQKEPNASSDPGDRLL
jgi:hypothetical protein